MDTPDGSGDHENYYVDVTEAFDYDGTHYTDCFKKALTIRSKDKTVSTKRLFDFNFRFMNGSDAFYMVNPSFQDEIPILRPDLT